MTERPDVDQRADPAGTPSSGPHDLTAKPAAPGEEGAGTPSATPGAYAADDEERQRGKAVKPGN